MVVHLEDLELLKKQHAEWDKLVKEEEERPYPDMQVLQDYKKHKLKVKEKIQETENKLFKSP